MDPMLMNIIYAMIMKKTMTTVLKMITMMTTKAVANKDSGSGGSRVAKCDRYICIYLIFVKYDKFV